MSTGNYILDQALKGSTTTRRYMAGVDLAFVRDACALVVLEHRDDCLRVVDFDFRQPKPGEPLDPIATSVEYIARIKSWGCKHVVADSHYVELLRREAASHGVTLLHAPSGDDRSRAWVTLRHYTRSRLIRYPREFVKPFSQIQAAPKPGGGLTITATRVAGTGHADVAFAACGAVWGDVRTYGLIGAAPLNVRAYRGAWGSP